MRAVLAIASLALVVVGCRANDLAVTNVNNGKQISTPSTTGSFTITDDTIAGIRDQMIQMFGSGDVQLATAKFGSDGTVTLELPDVPWHKYDSPVTLPQLISTPKTVEAFPAGGIDIPLVTTDDSDASTRETIRQLFKLTGLTDGFAAAITMDPSDVVAAYMPTAGSPEIPGIWFPLVLHLPSISEQDFACDCSKKSGSFLDCAQVCDSVTQGFAANGFDGVNCDAKIQIHALREIPLALGLVPQAQRPATTFNWTPHLEIGMESANPKSFVAGKNFHFGSMFDVSAAPGGAMTTYVNAMNGTFNCPASSDLCVEAYLYNCNTAGKTACDLESLKGGSCDLDFANGLTSRVAEMLSQGFFGAVGPQLKTLFEYDGTIFNPSPPIHFLDAPCSLLSLDKPGGCSLSDVENTLLPATLTYQKWDWFLGPFNQLGPMVDGYVVVTGVFPTESSTTRQLHSIHRTVHLASIRIDYNADPDNDTIPVGSDNCPGKPNQDQADADKDGYGDACDPCPCSPNEHTLNEDGLCDVCDPTLGPPGPDGSPFCKGYCAQNPPDNCVGVRNPDQHNCNKEAELALGLPPRGDACDPTPCSDAAADEEPLQATFAPACQPQTVTPSIGTSACNIGVDTRLRWRGVVDDKSVTHYGQTVFAHCPCTAPNATIADRLLNCQFVPGTSLNNCIDAQAGAFPFTASPPVNSNWTPMTTTYTTPGGFGSLSHVKTDTNHPYLTGYRLSGSTVHDQTWRFDEDLPEYGLTAPPTVTTEDQLLPLAEGLVGVTWAFTPAYEGVQLTGTTADLASHYFPQGLLPAGSILATILPINSCQLGGCGFPTPTVTIPPWLYVDPQGVIVYGTDRWIKPAPANTFDDITSSILADVGTAYTFVPAAETARRLEVRHSILYGALLDSTTGEFLAPVYSLFGRVHVGSLDYLGPSARAAARPVALVPPGVSTLSGLHGELYTVRLSADGASEILDRTDVRSSPVNPVVDSREIGGLDEPGQPLAATYDYDRDVIFVLDQVLDGRGTRLRLLGVGRDGIGRVLADAPLTGAYDRFFLSMDATGDPVISASPVQAAGRALVAVVQVPDDASSDALVSAWGRAPHQGRLLAAPYTACAGTWSFPRQGTSGAPRIDEIQPADLHVPKHAKSLGEVL